MNYGSSISIWKPWEECYLIFTMGNIYINSNLNPFTKFTRSSRNTEFKAVFSWKISEVIMKTVPISKGMVISHVMEWVISYWVWGKVNGNWANQMIRILQWRQSMVVQILASEEINFQISRTVTVTVRNPNRKVSHLSRVIWHRKTLTGLSFLPQQVKQSLWWALKSPKTITSAYGLIERTSSIVDVIAIKTVHKDKEGDQ